MSTQTADLAPVTDLVPAAPRSHAPAGFNDLLALELGDFQRFCGQLIETGNVGTLMLLTAALNDHERQARERRRAAEESLRALLQYKCDGGKAVEEAEARAAGDVTLVATATYKPRTPDRSTSAVLAKRDVWPEFVAACEDAGCADLLAQHFSEVQKVRHYTHATNAFVPRGGRVAELFKQLFPEREQPGEVEVRLTERLIAR